MIWLLLIPAIEAIKVGKWISLAMYGVSCFCMGFILGERFKRKEG
jgi:hypothetical protein